MTSQHAIEKVIEDAKQTSCSKTLAWYCTSNKAKTEKQRRFEQIRKAVYKAVNSNPNNPIGKKEFCAAMAAASNMSKSSATLLFKDVSSGGRTISFAKLDGYLDRTATKYAIEKFKAARGKDRYVDLREFIKLMKAEGMPKRRAKRIYGTIDENLDGYLTLTEFRDWASELLKLEVVEQEFLDKANWPPAVTKHKSKKRTNKTSKSSSKKPVDLSVLTKEMADLKTNKLLRWHDDSRAGRTAKQAEYEALRTAIMIAFDTNGSGKVGRREFVAATAAMRPPMSTQAAKRLYNDITTGFGAMSLAKLDGYLDRTAVTMAIKKYKKMRGGDRYIDPKEFVAYMEDEGMPSRKARSLFHKVDQNRDGRLNLREFRDWASDNLRVKVVEEQFSV